MRTTLTAMRINVAISTRKPVNLNDPMTPGLNIRIGRKRATWTWLGRDSQHGSAASLSDIGRISGWPKRVGWLAPCRTRHLAVRIPCVKHAHVVRA
jgi:hypothetical protein